MITLKGQDIRVTPSFVAQTESSRQVNIVARVSGFLDRIVYQEGELVKEGQVNFKLDEKPFQAQLDAARGALQSQRAASAHVQIVSPRMAEWLENHPWDAPNVKLRPMLGKGLDSAYAALADTYARWPSSARAAATTSPAVVHSRSCGIWPHAHATANGCCRDSCGPANGPLPPCPRSSGSQPSGDATELTCSPALRAISG